MEQGKKGKNPDIISLWAFCWIQFFTIVIISLILSTAFISSPAYQLIFLYFFIPLTAFWAIGITIVNKKAKILNVVTIIAQYLIFLSFFVLFYIEYIKGYLSIFIMAYTIYIFMSLALVLMLKDVILYKFKAGNSTYRKQ